jgi:hypothetical protein
MTYNCITEVLVFCALYKQIYIKERDSRKILGISFFFLKMFKKGLFLAIMCILGFIFFTFANANENGGKSSNGKKRKEMEIKILKEVNCKDEEKAALENVVRFHYKMSVVGQPDITDTT